MLILRCYFEMFNFGAGYIVIVRLTITLLYYYYYFHYSNPVSVSITILYVLRQVSSCNPREAQVTNVNLYNFILIPNTEKSGTVIIELAELFCLPIVEDLTYCSTTDV